MNKKINTKLAKLIKYYSLINHNLIYKNQSINRYKINNLNYTAKNKVEKLLKLKDLIGSIKNCELKKNATNLVFADGNLNSKLMIIGEGPGANEDKEGVPVARTRLIYGGKELQDERCLSDYNIQRAATLNMCLRLLGGGD